MEHDPMEMALSTDVVVKVILKHLKVKELLSSRFVSKFWNQAASSVLRKRSLMIESISDEEKLMELQECMEANLDFPFTGLTLKQPWLLNSDRAMNFFQNYGDRFTRLSLDTHWEYKLHDLAPFIDHLPHLSILEVGRDLVGYPPPIESSNVVRQKDDKILKLPSVRTIRITPYPNIDEEVLRQVLAAASPWVQIECQAWTSPRILGLLKNIGKLGAISRMRLYTDDSGKEYELKMDPFSPSESPALTKLHFSKTGCLSLDGLMGILLSSQHTLKKLRLEEMRLSDYSWEQFPVLAKLTTLNLTVEARVDQNCRYLFKGRHGHKFPALKQLDFTIWYGDGEDQEVIWSDGLFIVPSLTRIDFGGYVTPDGIKQLAQSFPNVVQVGLIYRHYTGDYKPSGRNPFEIWSVREFEHLEKLDIVCFEVKRPTKDYVNMDSFLTGMPVSICKKLRKQTELKLRRIKHPSRATFKEVTRDNPCVLLLKNLKELIVNVRLGYKLKEVPASPPFMSMVSVWYALQMMPNLRAKFIYDYDPLPILREDQNIAVLDTAFKHVQGYAKLEPYYY